MQKNFFNWMGFIQFHFFSKSPIEKYFSIKQYSKMKKYLLPISLILSLDSPDLRLCQELGKMAYE